MSKKQLLDQNNNHKNSVVEKKEATNYSTITDSITSLAEKMATINYSAINNSISSLTEKMVAINYSAINNSISSLAEKMVAINYSAINNSISSLAEKMAAINYSAINNSISSLAEKMAAINYSAIDNSITSLAEKMVAINYSTINNSITSLAEKMFTINYSAINNSITRLSEKLISNSYFSSLGDQLLNMPLDRLKFNSFVENFESISVNIDLENINYDDMPCEKLEEIKTSPVQLIEKIITGTLDYNDIKNNRLLVYPLLFIRIIIAFAITYLLTKNLDQLIDTNKNESYVNTEITSSQYNNLDLNLKIIITDKLNIRESPSTQSNIKGTLSNFDIVKVINQVPYWFEIEYIDLKYNETKTGWISKKYTADYFNTLDTYLEYFSK